MITKDDIENLATLARLDVADEDKEEFAEILGPILDYVSEVSSVVTADDATPRVGALRNVMREDGPARSGGAFTDAILKNAPETEDGYVRVKQIF